MADEVDSDERHRRDRSSQKQAAAPVKPLRTSTIPNKATHPASGSAYEAIRAGQRKQDEGRAYDEVPPSPQRLGADDHSEQYSRG